MIDIETLDTIPGAVVFEIGVVEFDPLTGETYREFFESIRIEESIEYGLTTDAETMEWWQKQGGVPMPAIVTSPHASEAPMLPPATMSCGPAAAAEARPTAYVERGSQRCPARSFSARASVASCSAQKARPASRRLGSTNRSR